MPDFSLEQHYPGIPVAGVDEAGRGPWAGPVVAAAVILWNGAEPLSLSSGINDSKKLSAARRENLFAEITTRFPIGVGIVEAETIDRLNILEATKLAMRRAVESLPSLPALALVDGPHAPALPCAAKPVIRGDAISLSIAAASIVAKVTRDHIMRDLHAAFPHYGWASNAGYGTQAHQEGIRLHGITPQHRRSFRPVRQHIEENA